MAKTRHVYCAGCNRCLYCHMKRHRRRPCRGRRGVVRVVSSRRVRKRQLRRSHRQRVGMVPKLSTACTQIASPKVTSSLVVSCHEPKCRQSHQQDHKEISPEMIHESIRELSMWRGAVDFQRILNYMQSRYPVAKNEKSLQRDLSLKLRVAQLAGIVHAEGGDRWALKNSLEQLRQIPQNLVTLFWQLYCDTMDPFKIQPRSPKAKVDRREDSEDSLPSIGKGSYFPFISTASEKDHK